MKLLLKIITCAMLVTNIRADCNVCQEGNQVACLSRNRYSICVDGVPSEDYLLCSDDYICTGEVSVCYSPENATPSCDEDYDDVDDVTTISPPIVERNKCGVCDADKVFACLNETSYGFCFGMDTLKDGQSDIVIDCPENTVCNIDNKEFCTDSSLATPSCIPSNSNGEDPTATTTTEEDTISTDTTTTDADASSTTTEPTTTEVDTTATETTTTGVDTSTTATVTTTTEVDTTTTETTTTEVDTTTTETTTTEVHTTTTETTTTEVDTTASETTTTEVGTTTTETTTTDADASSTTTVTTTTEVGTTTTETTTTEVDTTTTETTTTEVDTTTTNGTTTTVVDTTTTDSTPTTETDTTTSKTTTEEPTTLETDSTTTESTTNKSETDTTNTVSTTPADTTTTEFTITTETDTTTEYTTTSQPTETTIIPTSTPAVPRSPTELCQDKGVSGFYKPDNDSSCNKFIICYGSPLQGIVKYCPAELYFNPEKQICDTNRPEGCSIDTTTATASETTTTASYDVPRDHNQICADEGSSGSYKTEEDLTCTKFVYCYSMSGSMHGLVKNCPSGQYFHPDKKICLADKPEGCP